MNVNNAYPMGAVVATFAKTNQKQLTAKSSGNTWGENVDYVDDSLAAAFAEAVEDFKARSLRMGGLSDEEIEERMNAFREEHAPSEPYTEQEMELFLKKLDTYYDMLRSFGSGKREYMILSSMNEEQDDDGGPMGFMRSKLPSNPGLQHKLQN